jgi:hypothetical protein
VLQEQYGEDDVDLVIRDLAPSVIQDEDAIRDLEI